VGRDVLEVRPRQPSYVPAVEEVLGLVTAEPVRADLDTGTVSDTADRGAEQLTEALRLLVERQIAVDDIGLRRPSLDEAFLALTGRDSELEAQENAPAALDAA
jgi:ABC-2 type transport system ATP-binding protein